MPYTTRFALLLGATLVFCAQACASAPPKTDDDMPQDRVMYTPPEEARDDFAPLPRTAPVLEQPGSEGPAAVMVTDTSGQNLEIKRSTLDIVLAQGPSYPLRLVRVKPYRLQGRMVGHQITEFTSRNAQAAVMPSLMVGDVITHLNGSSLNTPKDYHDAWMRLKGASAIQVHLIRDKKTAVVTWTVK